MTAGVTATVRGPEAAGQPVEKAPGPDPTRACLHSVHDSGVSAQHEAFLQGFPGRTVRWGHASPSVKSPWPWDLGLHEAASIYCARFSPNGVTPGDGTARLTDDLSQFLGSTEVEQPKGTEVVRDAVRKLKVNAQPLSPPAGLHVVLL
ncbi:PTB domain-containing engulfment adapter protein 1 [Myotis davidii]|uniref:PTB domain-containing engulfment adapter protein 1 n=1 Tax=Myotis davidii TaxID=225400 RepID=L5LNV9_MYODS|nr:PTB domain-containing engulfment adapter protein 1 [Myotis davidii]